MAEQAAARWEWPLRRFAWLDVAWAGFAVANLVAMWLLPTWETVPFHFIWVSLTVVYGFRVWSPASTESVLALVVLCTGVVLALEVWHGSQQQDELTEVPLMASMFLAMVWHAKRRLAAMDDLQRISQQNLRLLEREHQFVQDASHELRTPITIALGHAELLARESRDPELAEDAHIVVDELLRLRRLADRLLLLASSADPGFLSRSPVPVAGLLAAARSRWAPTERRWVLDGRVTATVLADPDRLDTALDALIENAVKRTGPDGQIRLGARRVGDGGSGGSSVAPRSGEWVAITVADSGPGIAAAQLERIFDRFARLDAARSRDRGGVGLGLAIVKAIAEAHGGTARVRSTPGKGSVFEILLPLLRTPPGGTAA